MSNPVSDPTTSEHGGYAGTEHGGYGGRVLGGRAREGFEKASDNLADADRALRRLATERPIAAVLGAFAVGYVAGRLLSKL